MQTEQMPKVTGCDATECSYNQQGDCHAMAITIGGAADHIEHGAAVLMGRVNIQETKFICACFVICPRAFNGIARVAQPDEIHAFNDAPISNIETRNDACF